jgi:diacylglycerol kinase family enzyme
MVSKNSEFRGQPSLKRHRVIAGGGDGTIKVFAAANAAGLPAQCSLGILPLGTANDFAQSAGDLTALRMAASAAFYL